MKKVAEKYFKNPKKYIPYGMYCYQDELLKACPFWQFDKTKPEQQSGYCAYLGLGDWMENGTIDLWERLKECDINWDEDEDLGDLDDIDT